MLITLAHRLILVAAGEKCRIGCHVKSRQLTPTHDGQFVTNPVFSLISCEKSMNVSPPTHSPNPDDSHIRYKSCCVYFVLIFSPFSFF